MRTILGFWLVVMLAAFQAVGEESKPNNQPATAQPTARLPFVKQIRKTVTFITLNCTDNNNPQVKQMVQGTGFFVSYPDQRLGPGQQFSYLVTNRHVAMCWNEDGQPMHVNSISARVNLKDGSSVEAPLSPNGGNAEWILPADDSVDLALLPRGPDAQKVDYLTIPVSALATEDVVTSQNIFEGSKIMLTGFFYQFPGARQLEPILREGVLAMIPDEDITTTTGKPGKLYLGEVHSFGGNSGSPVFVDLGGLRGGALTLGESYKMLGVVSGLYFEDQEFDLQIATTLKGKTRANSGITMIVPAFELKKLLDDPRVQSIRDAEAVQLNHQHAENFNGLDIGGHDKSVRVEPELRFTVSLMESFKTADSVTAVKNGPKQ